MAIKKCINCRFFEYVKHIGICKNKDTTGELGEDDYLSCTYLRLKGQDCGKEGKLYQPHLVTKLLNR